MRHRFWSLLVNELTHIHDAWPFMDGVVFIQFRLGHLIGEHCTMSQCRRCNFPIVNFCIRFFGLSPVPCPEYDINPCARKWNFSDDLERTTRRRNVRRRTANCISCNICARECHKFCTRKTLANTSLLLANRDFGFHCLKIVSHNFYLRRCLRTSLCLCRMVNSEWSDDPTWPHG